MKNLGAPPARKPIHSAEKAPVGENSPIPVDKRYQIRQPEGLAGEFRPFGRSTIEGNGTGSHYEEPSSDGGQAMRAGNACDGRYDCRARRFRPYDG